MIERKPTFFFEFYQKSINTINDLIDDDRGFFSWSRLEEKYELDKGLYLKSSKSYGQKPLGSRSRPPGLNTVNYSNRKFPYSRRKLYSEFPTPRAVQSGKSLTLTRGASEFHLINP